MIEDKLLEIHTPEGTTLLPVETELKYVVKSPGMPVHFSDGKVINMNRSERRRNKLYGSRLKRIRRG